MFRFTSILLMVLTLISTGCQKNANDQVGYENPAQSRPLVALVPVIDNTKNDTLEWNLSDEFTSLIYSCLSEGPLYFENLPKVREIVKKCKDEQSPFGSAISWIKKAFEKERFVIFLELVKHEEVLNQQNATNTDLKLCSADLNLSMRIRVFDLRGEEPCVILQEIINDTHFIPRQFTRINFQQAAFGDDGFHFSPLGIAHWEFAKRISARIEDYICLSCKKL